MAVYPTRTLLRRIVARMMRLLRLKPDFARARRTAPPSRTCVAALGGLILGLATPGPALAEPEDVIGHVLFSNGGLTIADATLAGRAAVKGEVVRLGEAVSTSAGAVAQIKLKQGALIHLRSATEVAFESGSDIDSFVEARVMRVLKGSIRLINRETSQRQTLAVKTASASLLFSDADGEVFVIPAAQDGKADPEPGTYAFTNAGIGSMKTKGGSVAIAPGAIAFASAAESLPPALISLLPASVEAMLLDATRHKP